MHESTKEHAYEMVLEELARNDLKAGLVARAKADSLGDEKKAESLYIKYRAKQIYKKLREEAEEAEKEKLKWGNKPLKERLIILISFLIICLIFFVLILAVAP